MSTATARQAVPLEAGFAGAKINLSLRVVGRRADGYHLLESLVVHAADVGDRLRATVADTLSLTIEGPYQTALDGEDDNLVLCAARLLDASGSADITLEKYLPVASGVGGGSADAAAALRLLNELWDRGHDVDRLRALGAGLGADVAMCVEPRPAFVTGIGDTVERLAVPSLHLVLVNPNVPVPTPAVFAARVGNFSAPLGRPSGFTDVGSVLDFIAAAGNDLYPPACTLRPEIAECARALRALSECRHVGMSGSGATCFGIFMTREASDSAAASLARERPDWWVRPATTLGQTA